MYTVKIIKDNRLKQHITSTILRDLEEWFGIEESTQEYITKVAKYPFFALYDNDVPVAFYSVREENKNVLDLYVLGALKTYHNKGVGSTLQNYVEQYAKDNNYNYLMVLTLAEKANSKEYLLTRQFYLKHGFIDFYQNDDIFDSYNPCQIMLKKVVE